VLGLAACSSKPTLDYDQLRATMTEADAQALQPHLDWKCTDDDPANGGRMGQRVCDAPTTALNDIPAARVDYLFRDGKLAFAIIEFNPDAYDAVAKDLDAKHSRRGTGDSSGAFAGLFNSGVTSWNVQDGVVATSATEKKPDGNVFAVWISNDELNRHSGD
jgi:hypothetical protein